MRLIANKKYALKVPGESPRVVNYLCRVRPGIHLVFDMQNAGSSRREVKREWVEELEECCRCKKTRIVASRTGNGHPLCQPCIDTMSNGAQRTEEARRKGEEENEG